LANGRRACLPVLSGGIVKTCGWGVSGGLFLISFQGVFGIEAAVVGSLDECAVLEGGAGADEGDQMRGVDHTPARLGGL